MPEYRRRALLAIAQMAETDFAQHLDQHCIVDPDDAWEQAEALIEQLGYLDGLDRVEARRAYCDAYLSKTMEGE